MMILLPGQTISQLLQAAGRNVGDMRSRLADGVQHGRQADWRDFVPTLAADAPFVWEVSDVKARSRHRPGCTLVLSPSPFPFTLDPTGPI